MQCVTCDGGNEIFKLYLDELHALYINVHVRDKIEFDLHEIYVLTKVTV
jgi:hypothetical protein